MESIGAYLRVERESRNISLDQVSQGTKIRRNILEAIEEDQQNPLPPFVFTRGFLAAYAKYVGLDPNDVIARYEKFLKEREDFGGGKDAERPLRRGRFRILLAIIFTLLILVAGLFFLSWYRSVATRKATTPPRPATSSVPRSQIRLPGSTERDRPSRPSR